MEMLNKILKISVLSTAILYLITGNLYSEDVRSITEERRDTIRFGIDSEIVELLKKLKEEPEVQFQEELKDVFLTSANTTLRNEVLAYFSDKELNQLAGSVITLFEEWEDIDTELLINSLNYLGEIQHTEAGEILLTMLDSDSQRIQRSVIKNLGKIHFQESEGELLRLFDDDETDEEIQIQIIETLGKLKSPKAMPLILDIAEDEDEEMGLRMAAAKALGSMEVPEAIAVLKGALNSSDTYFRAEVIRSLAKYKSSEIVPALHDGLRDSFWRVRVASADALGELRHEASTEILLYKMKYDPENNVRIASVKALAQIATSQALDGLKNYVKDEHGAYAIRSVVAQQLVENHFSSSVNVLKEIAEKEWETENSKLLDIVCKGFARNDAAGGHAAFFERMLSHRNVIIKIYGIQGIGNNRLGQFREKIEELSKEGNSSSIRKQALDALEKL